jgi:hypothetical protein
MYEALAQLATAQDGVFTTAQALGLGIDDFMLSDLVRRRECRHLARGAYAWGLQVGTPEQIHLELCRGLLLLYPDAVLAGRSAAAAYGLPLWGVDYSRARLERPVARQVRRSGAVIRPVSTSATTLTAYGRAVDPEVACVQVALDHGAIAGVVVTDSALHRQLVDLPRVEAEIMRRAGNRRIQHALAMLSLVDAGSESVGESRTRVILTSHGFEIETQVVVRDQWGVIGRVDMQIKGTNVLVEFDGALKYADDPRALFREKRREDRLRRLGYVVIRVTWADLEAPGRLIALAREALGTSAA